MAVDIDKVVEDLSSELDKEVGDTRKYSQADSVEIYEGLADHCREWADMIQGEIDAEEK